MDPREIGIFPRNPIFREEMYSDGVEGYPFRKRWHLVHISHTLLQDKTGTHEMVGCTTPWLGLLRYA